MHLLPLTLDPDYLDDCLDQAAALGATAVHLSHKLCHHADSVIDNPERAAMLRPFIQQARQQELEVWCWSHEFHTVPPELLDADGRLYCDDPRLADVLAERYRRLHQALPGLSGIVLTFAECRHPVYKDHRVVSQLPAPARVRRLIEQLLQVLRPLGLRLSVRDFVYRLDEVEAMREALAGLPPEVAVMSKCVPHDWHPDYPPNPLLGAFPDHEQWVEHDLGFEYEGQHWVPFANHHTLEARVSGERAHGIRTWCLRLDRYNGFNRQSALYTPWGGLMLAVHRAAAAGDDVDAARAAWEADHFRGALDWLTLATDAVRRLYFPHGQWYVKHSALPPYTYTACHLCGGNADRLAVWTGDPAHRAAEQAMNDLPPGWAQRLIDEGDALATDMARLAEELHDREGLGPQDEDWRRGATHLAQAGALFAAHRHAYFRIAERRLDPDRRTVEEIASAIDRLDEICVCIAPDWSAARCKGVDPTPFWQDVIDSLRQAAGDQFCPARRS